MIVNVLLPAAAIGEAGCVPTVNIAASVPLIATFGVPVRLRLEVPRFWIVKVIAPLVPPTRTLPNE